MRCKNCGWENPNGLTNCEKCNTPLSGAVNNQAYGPAAPQAVKLNKTVMEGEVFPQQAPAGPAANVCPSCGYPMRPGVKECPNCHQKVVDQAIPEPAPTVPEKPAAPNNQKKGYTGTVNPWIQVTPASKCSLHPVEQPGMETPEVLNLKGDSHELSRANLDPENQTITSKVQAELTCEDGQWYIQDHSSQHTTFVYAGAKTPIKDGDVILMGNRQFIFHEKK